MRREPPRLGQAPERRPTFEALEGRLNMLDVVDFYSAAARTIQHQKQTVLESSKVRTGPAARGPQPSPQRNARPPPMAWALVTAAAAARAVCAEVFNRRLQVAGLTRVPPSSLT